MKHVWDHIFLNGPDLAAAGSLSNYSCSLEGADVLSVLSVSFLSLDTVDGSESAEPYLTCSANKMIKQAPEYIDTKTRF